jgi:hypothetical protein
MKEPMSEANFDKTIVHLRRGGYVNVFVSVALLAFSVRQYVLLGSSPVAGSVAIEMHRRLWEMYRTAVVGLVPAIALLLIGNACLLLTRARSLEKLSSRKNG